jgi:hypothetical protein
MLFLLIIIKEKIKEVGWNINDPGNEDINDTKT